MPADGWRAGRHEYLVERLPRPSEPEARSVVAETLDDRLRTLNDDYRELRKGGVSLQEPFVQSAPEDGFLRWMKHHRGLGGQNKVPRTIAKAICFDDILRFMLEDGERDPE